MSRPALDSAARKKPTNLSLDADLVAEARQIGINVSAACEDGLRNRIADIRARRWREENAAAIESSNAYVEREGLPLARFRRF